MSGAGIQSSAVLSSASALGVGQTVVSMSLAGG